MTQEEKQLLLKDLSARLPYGVIGEYIIGGKKHIASIIPFYYMEITMTLDGFRSKDNMVEFKPYLRPMSSMTEEEKKDFGGYIHTQPITHQQEYKGYTVNCSHYYTVSEIDWLNANHFDYRGLIDKGLALEAPVDMYEKD